MLGTFIAAVALLAVMLYLIVRPFLTAPREVSDADVAHEAIAIPVAATVSVGAATATAEVADAAVVSDQPDVAAAPPVAQAESTDDVRARVEALIAARKAELSAPKCSGCNTAVSPDDAFCRSCGTKLN
jgi:hypothetical protein